QNDELRPESRAKLADAIRIAPGFFDADDIFAIAHESFDRVDTDFHATPRGDAVKQDGEFRGIRNGAKVLKQTFLRRLVVVRRDLERTIRTAFFRRDGQVNRFVRRIATGAGEHFESAGGEFDRQFDNVYVLLETERR